MAPSSHFHSSGRLAGLRVAVTGGTSGLGLALVRELLGREARVAFVARTAERVAQVAREQPGAHGIVGDVSLKDDIYPMAMQIVGELGGLDVLVHNASDLGPAPLRLLGDTDCEDLERALAVNVVGPFRLTKAVLGALAASAREGPGALVLNVSSDAAVNAYPRWGAYGASKAALRHLTAIWDAELAAEGVRLLSIDPGDMDTPLHAAAVPNAEPATLKRPEMAAAELADAMAAALSHTVNPLTPNPSPPKRGRGVSGASSSRKRGRGEKESLGSYGPGHRPGQPAVEGGAS
jgi:NAD(P)-dependent dehydrogenase (short-subunit alcohol dehydrogenase family)